MAKNNKGLKPKKCKFCKELFTPVKGLQSVCSYSCAINLSRQKNLDEHIKVLKEKLKTLGEYEQEARVVFQKWIRQRDKDLPCISCGTYSNRYDAGHYFSAGIYSGLIFHEWNVNKQCSYFCNKMNHGNIANYRIGLIKKIGQENVIWLEENKDRLKNYKYTKDELISIKKEYNNRLKSE